MSGSHFCSCCSFVESCSLSEKLNQVWSGFLSDIWSKAGAFLPPSLHFSGQRQLDLPQRLGSCESGLSDVGERLLPTPLNVWREEGSQNQTETRGKVGERDHEAQASLLVSRLKKKKGGGMQQMNRSCYAHKTLHLQMRQNSEPGFKEYEPFDLVGKRCPLFQKRL